MKFLFIADPLDSFKVEKDSTLAMMRAASAAGHAIWYTQSHDLLWGEGKARARCQAIQLLDGEHWYALGSFEEHPLEYFSAVLMRQDPPFTVEYLTGTWILSAAVLQGRGYLIRQMRFAIILRNSRLRSSHNLFLQAW